MKIDFVTVKFGTDNEAFAANQNAEIARVFRDLADRVETGRLPQVVRDANGNYIGEVVYVEAE